MDGFERFPKKAAQFKPLINEIIKNGEDIQQANIRVGRNKGKTAKSDLQGLLKEFPIYSLIYFEGLDSLTRLQQAIF